MTTLLIAEHNKTALKEATAKALSAAQQLGAPVHILVAGANSDAAVDEAAKLQGVEKVLYANSALYDHALAEPLANLVVSLADGYDALVAPATSSGKNVMPRVAALLDVMQISDVCKVISADTFERPIYAGNAVQTVQATDAKKVLTIRATAFPMSGTGAAAPVAIIPELGDSQLSQFKSEEIVKSERPELSSAKVVISGGRSLASKDNFVKYIEPVANRLGAAIGASRAAVDAGYAPNDWQVGQTGKVVAPELYIAVGISGAIQHLAGMKDSKIVVAINKDQEAPIFQVSDFGIVGDLFSILPELDQELAKIGR